MADIDLTQAEADALLAMEKFSEDSTLREFPAPGERIEIPLVSENRRERFFLDVSRSAIIIVKGTYQNRAREVIVLARLDFGGKPQYLVVDLHPYQWLTQLLESNENFESAVKNMERGGKIKLEKEVNQAKLYQITY